MSNSFTESIGPGGLPVVEIRNNAATARICLMGAHVLSYTPAGQEDLLFISEKSEYSQTGKAIRGGVPICWPWFGPAAQSGVPGATTAHGFIRQFMWKFAGVREISDRMTAATFTISDSPESLAIWPHKFMLTLEVVVGDTLTLTLITTNTGDQEFTIAQALHTYFSVGEIERTIVCGFENLKFIDKAPATPPAPNPQQDFIDFTAETDRVYLNANGEAVILDPVKHREIHIAKTNSDTGVVWNPWINKSRNMPDFGDEEYHRMVCVEVCNVDYDAPAIAPGASHALSTTISAVSLLS